MRHLLCFVQLNDKDKERLFVEADGIRVLMGSNSAARTKLRTRLYGEVLGNIFFEERDSRQQLFAAAATHLGMRVTPLASQNYSIKDITAIACGLDVDIVVIGCPQATNARRAAVVSRALRSKMRILNACNDVLRPLFGEYDARHRGKSLVDDCIARRYRSVENDLYLVMALLLQIFDRGYLNPTL